MIPRTSVDLDSAIPAEHKGWTPKGDDLSEDGFAYFPAKPDELGSLLGCQPGSLAGIRLFLVHPGLHSRLTQIEVLGYLADAAVALAAQLDDLSFELRGERPTRTGFLRSMVSILDILSGAAPLMVDVRQTGGGPAPRAIGITSLVLVGIPVAFFLLLLMTYGLIFVSHWLT